MDRIVHATAVDIGGGKRGFRSKDTVAGLPGTVVTAGHMNAVQEEIMKVIEAAGLSPDDVDLTQLWQAIKRVGGVPFRGAALFTESGTFNPVALGLTALDRILVFCWGGGGGGAAPISSAGASGAGGGLAIKSMDCPASPQTVTIGAGGPGNNVGSNGVAGGTSSFGAHCSATGGTGGAGGATPGGAGIGGSINLNGSSGCDIMNAAQDWAPGGAAPFMGPGLLNNSAGSPFGSGGAAILSGPQSDPGRSGAVIVFY